MILELERFLLGETESFKRNDETFNDVGEIREYCDDGEDAELNKILGLLDILMENETRVNDFYAMIRESYIPLDKDESISDFDGTILTTCHGAKGLEFDNVYIHDDFSFATLTLASDFLNKPRLCDEINLIYVAVTRAKKRVFLSEKARDFFEHINPDKHISSISLHVMRRSLEESWRRFALSEDPIESEADIPWPSGPNANNPFCLDREMSEQEQKSYMQQMFRRFHTDKFLPLYRERMEDINEEESRKIIEKLHQYLAKAREIYQILQPTDDGSSYLKLLEPKATVSSCAENTLTTPNNLLIVNHEGSILLLLAVQIE